MRPCSCRQACPHHAAGSRCNSPRVGRDYCKACKSTLNKKHRMKAKGLDPSQLFIVDELPCEDTPLEEIIATRRSEFERRHIARSARRAIPINITLDGPIGIALFGDLHIDDPGTNFPLIEAHTDLVLNTKGMYAAAIGDIQNAWIGRLAQLYSAQQTTARDAWKLCDWWINRIKERLLFLVSGNHDWWAKTVNRIDPLEWIMAGAKSEYALHGARFEIILPSGDSYFINARHDFKGSSQYNNAHGVTKAAVFGRYDDLLVAGHLHTTGVNLLKNPDNGRACHPLRLGSYKWYDDFALEQGFMDGNITECAVFMIDPYEPDPRHRTWIELNPFRAAKILTMMRGK